MQKEQQLKITENSLYKAILKLKTSDECEKFFNDLCTPAELTAMKGRWRVTELLDTGSHSYREIQTITGVSLATISRVARFLKQEAYQGYRLILNRLHHRHSI